jgi:ankyrin repeat protein
LANMGQALHNAVLHRSEEMVRLLMDYGANPHDGFYPHREATTPMAVAEARGYEEILAILRDAELRRRERNSGVTGAPAPDALFQAIASGNDERAIAMMEADPALIRTCHPLRGWTPLHVAARSFNTGILTWLLDHDAHPGARGWHDFTPLDLAADRWDETGGFADTASLLIRRGAAMTARAASALGDAEWLRARHAAGDLVNAIEDAGGLLRIAVTHDRPEILTLLLGWGFDPDERIRCGEPDEGEATFSWGMPLWHCAGAAKYAMAEMLLERGADPNGRVMASGDPMFQAYSRRDWKMVALLERYGGVANATTAGLYRQTDLAKRMLSGEAKYALDGVGGDTLAEQLLWGAACGGDPEITRLALERVDWPRDDPRWFTMLEQPLRIWSHGTTGDEWDRGTYLTCFRLVLERCDPNLRGRPQDDGRFGLTILHSIAGSREHVTPAERAAFAAMALEAGARTDIRDHLLNSTPLGWACRWGRAELIKLLLERGADPVENDAEPWARPRAWADRMGHTEALAILDGFA